METVFFYGLFMDADLLREKHLNPSSPIIGYVEGYGLRIGERATLVPSSGERTYGTVMQLTREEIATLYSGDGVEDYQPVRMTIVSMEGNHIPAKSYLLPASMLSGRNRDYAKSLAMIAKKTGLEADYITEIDKWAN